MCLWSMEAHFHLLQLHSSVHNSSNKCPEKQHMPHVSVSLCGIKKTTLHRPTFTLRSSALFSEVLTHYSHVSFSEDYRTMIYEYSNRNCSGFEKSNTGVLLTNQEDVNGPREMPKTLKMILK